MIVYVEDVLVYIAVPKTKRCNLTFWYNVFQKKYAKFS